MKESTLYFQFNLNVFRELWGEFFISLFALSIDLKKPDKNKTTKNKNKIPTNNCLKAMLHVLFHIC